MSSETGLWTPAECNVKKSFVCKHSAKNHFPNIRNKTSGLCPPSWWDFGGRFCYFSDPGSDRRTWQDAEAFCESMNSTLITFHTNEEVEAMLSISNYFEENFWVGLEPSNSPYIDGPPRGNSVTYFCIHEL